MTETTQNKKHKRKGSSGFRIFLLSAIPIVVFSLGFIPTIITIKLLLYVINFTKLIDFIFLPFIITLEILLLIISEMFISGLFIRIFHIKYKEGTYEYDYTNNTAFKWMLFCQLYTPIRKTLEIVPMGHIKTVYMRLIGMKIGKHSLVGGVIKDPCMTEFGDNSTMGEYAIIYAHIHNYEKQTITIQKVSIGNNCVVGAGSIIMPGVIMKDHSVVGAGALVPKNRVLETQKIYVGNPAKELMSSPKKQENQEGTTQ